MRVLKCGLAAAALCAGMVVLAGAAATAATPNCTSSQITLTIGRSNGAAGTFYYPIVFTNDGGTCVIWGVPQVQPVSGPSRAPVGPKASNASMGQMPARHTLKKGQAVHDGYGVGDTSNYPVNLCEPKSAAGIVVSLPGFVKATYLPLKMSTCTTRASTHSMLLSPGAGS